jgi:hypothetical protein
MFKLNYIVKAVEKIEQTINTKNFSKEKLITLHKTLAFSPIEYAQFQEVKSLLHASGILSLESAQWIYNKLSNYSACNLAEKYILYELFAKFLQIKASMVAKRI